MVKFFNTSVCGFLCMSEKDHENVNLRQIFLYEMELLHFTKDVKGTTSPLKYI